jgi:phospholipid/cholesterol/gamma-HCH transport system substrate-binding protein
VSAAPERRLIRNGAIVVVGAAALFMLTFLGVIPALLGGARTTVRANFTTTGGLNVSEPVRVDGVTVGRVTAITGHGPDSDVTVTMKLDKDAGHLYANARATIRWRTVLGGAYAVNIDRGTPGLAPLGHRIIPASQTTNQVEIDEVTSALRAGERRGLRTTFTQLPRALADPSAPGTLLADFATAAGPIARGLPALEGQRPDRDLRDLITNTAATTTALNAPPRPLRSLIQNAAITTQATGARARDLQATLEIGARVLPRTRSTLADLDETLELADPVISALRRPAEMLAPTLVRLRPVLTGLDALLTDKARPLLASLRPTAAALASAARAGIPTLDALTPSLRRIDREILPTLARRSTETRLTTYEAIGPAVSGLEGAAGHYDDESQVVRLLGTGSAHFVDALPCNAYFTEPTSPALLQCKALSDALGRVLTPSSRGGH